MVEVIIAVMVAILSYIVAVNYGIWCGTATLLILLIIYKKARNF